MKNYKICKQIAERFVEFIKTNSLVNISEDDLGFHIVNEAKQHSMNFAMTQALRSTANKGNTFKNCVNRIYCGELAEQVIFSLLSIMLENDFNMKLYHNTSEDDQNKSLREFYYDLKTDNLKFEIKLTKSKRSYIDWQDQSKIQTLIDNCHEIDLIFFCKIDNKNNIYPVAIMYGRKFNFYLEDSRFSTNYSNPKFLNHSAALRDGYFWYINKQLLDKNYIPSIFENNEIESLDEAEIRYNYKIN